MADKNFVVRQGTIKFTKADLNPSQVEILGVTSDGLVVTTGIPSGNFDNYTLLTTTENISSDLQNQINSLSAASSGGISSINNVTNPGGNIDLVTSTSEVSITPNDGANEVAIDVDLSAYATTAITDALSGAIDTNASDISTLQGANYVNTLNSLTGDLTIAAGDNVGVSVAGTTITISANEGITNHNDLSGLQGGTTNEYYHWTASDYADRILTTEVASISAGLDGRITSLESADYVNTIEGLSGVIDISGSGGVTISTDGNTLIIDGASAYTDEQAQDAVGLILVDTNSIDFTYDDGTPQITADVIVNSDSLEIGASGVRLKDTITGARTFSDNVTVNGNLYVNGTEFIVDTTTVSASDNIIVINGGETGAGVTAGTAGIQVDRGTETDYQFVFRESDDTFVIGEIGNLQAVATREDTPLDGGYAQWNDSANRFDAVPASTIVSDISGSFVNIDGDTMTGTLSVPDIEIGSGGAISTQVVSENNDVDTGTEVVDSFASTLGTGAMWIVAINDGTNYRTSTVIASWDGTSIEFTETSTVDIGDTSGLDMDVVINGADVELRATTTSDNWTVKAHRILL